MDYLDSTWNPQHTYTLCGICLDSMEFPWNMWNLCGFHVDRWGSVNCCTWSDILCTFHSNLDQVTIPDWLGMVLFGSGAVWNNIWLVKVHAVLCTWITLIPYSHNIASVENTIAIGVHITFTSPWQCSLPLLPSACKFNYDHDQHSSQKWLGSTKTHTWCYLAKIIST